MIFVVATENIASLFCTEFPNPFVITRDEAGRERGE